MTTDPVEAYKWMALAAGQGEETAKKNMSLLKTAMTSAQIAEGEKRARDSSRGSPGHGDEIGEAHVLLRGARPDLLAIGTPATWTPPSWSWTSGGNAPSGPLPASGVGDLKQLRVVVVGGRPPDNFPDFVDHFAEIVRLLDGVDDAGL